LCLDKRPTDVSSPSCRAIDAQFGEGTLFADKQGISAGHALHTQKGSDTYG